MKRILILADGMAAGGTERQIVELLKGLRSYNSIETAFGVLLKGGEREIDAKTYADLTLPISQKSQYDFTLAFSLISLVKKYKIDLIHTFGCVSDFAGVVAGRCNGIPTINGSIRSARYRLSKRDRISRFCMHFADWIVANSHAGIKAFGVDQQENSSVIYNGVDLSRFSEVVSGRYDEKPSICMVGNFTAKKNHSQLIEVLPKLHIKFPALQLVLVGRGERISLLKQQVASLGLLQSVSFVTDCNSPESIIKACDIGILLSPQGEGLSNAIMEYMALEKPVIATDMGGNCELVKHGKTGYLVSGNDSGQLVGYVDCLLSNPKLAVKMGIAGCKRITNQFTDKQMTANYERLYIRLLA